MNDDYNKERDNTNEPEEEQPGEGSSFIEENDAKESQPENLQDDGGLGEFSGVYTPPPEKKSKEKDGAQPKSGISGIFARLTKKYGKMKVAMGLSYLVIFIVIIAVVFSMDFSSPMPDDVAVAVMSQRSFTTTGSFRLSGLEYFSEGEIEENLVFDPPASFTVEKDGNGYVTVTLDNFRNIPYTGTFTSLDKDGKEEAHTFALNTPGMTVRIGSNSSRVYKYGSLELVFSEQVDIYSLQENLTIEPRTAYTLSYNLNKVTITPDVEWITTDNYQIHISADYASKTGKQFANDQVLYFKVRDPAYESVELPDPFISFRNKNTYVLSENKDMTLLFYGEYLDEKIPVLVETYRMDSMEKFKNQSHIYLDYDLDLASLEKVDTNAFLLENGENKFTVPNFGDGTYILSASYIDPLEEEEVQVRTSYVVTPLSVYMQSSNRETVIWLNSMNQETPLAGYEVTFDDKSRTSGVTDENGLLILNHESGGDSSSPFTVTDPDGTLVYYDDDSLYRSKYQSERYYSYLFLDRTLYRPEDEVCFWGFVRPFRYNEQELPETVTVRFDPGGLDIEVEVELAESGVFHGEIPLERIKSTQYAVQAELYFPPEDEEGPGVTRVIETEYVSVKEFEKPSYVLSSEIDRSYYGPYDTVTVTASASFYDGTPLPFYPLEVSYFHPGKYTWETVSGITTDSSGVATFSFPANTGDDYIGSSKSPMTNQYMVRIASDGENITHMKNYRYFPSDTLVDITISQQDSDNLSLTVNTYSLDMESQALASYFTGSSGYYGLSNDRLLQIARGEPVDVDLNIALRWSYTDVNKITHRNRQSPSSGSYTRFENSYSLDYDTVTWDFETIDDWETQEKRIAVETVNGVAVVPDLIYLREGNRIDFSETVTMRAYVDYEDGLGNSCSHAEYYPDYDWYYYDEYGYDDSEQIIQGYSFAVTNLTTDTDVTPYDSYLLSLSMGAEQQARFQLLHDSQPVENEGRLLYTVIQEGLYEYNITGNDFFNLSYPMDYGRSVRLVAAYFDGYETHYVRQIDISATSESLGIDLEITPDRDSYRPGDQVTLQVRATDYMGRGVAGNLCIAVVDESIFALSEQTVDALWGLYSNMWMDNSVQLYCTTYRDEPYSLNYGDGGKGDGGRVEFYDSYRSNFKDTALFLPTTTNAAGNSTVTFILPDNTTSWRITAVEVGNDLRAGNVKTNIISSLPFFVKPVITSKYIEGDDIALLAQGHGTLLDESSAISYTVTITGDETDITLTGDGKAYEALEFNFGKLPIGEYTVVTRAQYSGYADTVELPLSVIKSNLELVVHKQIDIGESLDISAMRYPVTITFYDNSNQAFMTSINSLFGHYCMQASQRMSRFVAKRVVRQTVEGGGHIPFYIAEGNDYVSDMQNDDGGIGYYEDAASDPLVTTYVLLVAKDNFNLTAMSRYFHNQLEKLTDEKKRAACYLGLAAIGDLDAEELMELLENADASLDVQAYLIAALAYLGETDAANELYAQRLEPHISTINDGSKKDLEWERDAAAIWIAASRLHHDDADTLSLHFGKTVWRYRTLFECMIYVTNYDRHVTSTSFTYTLKGTTTTVDLGLTGMRTLVLSKSDLESISFSNVPDSLRATAYYVGEPTEIGIEQSDNMSIEKSVEELDDNTYEVTLTIHLTEDAPTGQYDISDWVPSNTRLYSYDKSYKVDENRTISFRTTNENQNLYVAFNNNAEKEQTIIFKYRIRQTFQSQSVLDTVYMIHGDTGDNCNTEKSTFAPSAMQSGNQVVSAE